MGKTLDVKDVIKNGDQALSDLNVLNRYINNLKTLEEIDTKPLPSVVKELTTDSIRTDCYSQMFGITAGALVSGVATSVVSSSITTASISSVGALSLPAISSLGLGSLGLGIINPVYGITMFAALAPALIKNIKLKTYKKDHSAEFNSIQKETTKSKNKIKKWIDDCQNQIVENNKLFDESMHEFGTRFKRKAQDLSKKVAIQFDDFINTDVNKRILQYNEVILDQYKNQKELEDQLADILIQYNSLLEENKRLAKTIEELTALLTSLGVSGTVISAIAGENER